VANRWNNAVNNTQINTHRKSLVPELDEYQCKILKYLKNTLKTKKRGNNAKNTTIPVQTTDRLFVYMITRHQVTYANDNQDVFQVTDEAAADETHDVVQTRTTAMIFP